MGKLLRLCLALLTCARLTAVSCLQCAVTLFSLPCPARTVTCQEGQLCAPPRGCAASHNPITRNGCAEKAKCNTNDTMTSATDYFTTYYYLDYKQGNLPVGAGTCLSLAARLAMLAAWLTQGL